MSQNGIQICLRFTIGAESWLLSDLVDPVTSTGSAGPPRGWQTSLSGIRWGQGGTGTCQNGALHRDGFGIENGGEVEQAVASAVMHNGRNGKEPLKMMAMQ